MEVSGSSMTKVMNHKNRIIGLLALIHLIFCATTASAWWNEEWELRRQIDFDTTAQGADIQEGLVDIPILLRLHSGNFDFSKVKQDGSDIRFVSSDDQTTLKYQIDTFDIIDEIGLIWVKVPKITANSRSNHIFMYYGNEKAVDSQDSSALYANGFSLVYHLNESQGPPQDASVKKNNAAEFSGGQGLPSVIDKGIALYGGRDIVSIPSSVSLRLAAGFTLSTWVKISQPQADGYLFSQEQDGNGIIVGVEGESVYARIVNNETTTQTEGNAQLTPGSWHHLAVTAQPGSKIRIFIDGQEAATAIAPSILPEMTSNLSIGFSAADNHSFSGEFDEFSIAGTPRTAAWIKASFSSQGLQANLAAIAPELSNDTGFLPSYYLKTIMANITLDGWLIIGLLIFLGIASMLVLLGKIFFFLLSNKDNKAFQAYFSKNDNVLAQQVQEATFENSPLYRIYRTGCHTLTAILAKTDRDADQRINDREMNLVKASLEKGYVRETKGLNNWLVVLTLAISGGPFLGLLGTVWGVMNTFAAMAEAGEANIMAIAPGVASALSTTVFGLIVAIPALFGYNYLAGKIKDQTAEIGIFIDEFSLMIDNQLGDEK